MKSGTRIKRHCNGGLAEPKRRRRNGWTPERRARQAALIRTWRPWTRSTGPKTAAGKMRTRLNAQTHGFRGARGREFYAAIREQRKLLRAINQLAAFLDSHSLNLQKSHYFRKVSSTGKSIMMHRGFIAAGLSLQVFFAAASFAHPEAEPPAPPPSPSQSSPTRPMVSFPACFTAKGERVEYEMASPKIFPRDGNIALATR
ncbi:MAG TPA: hypothetical protein VIG74_00815, partial [Alphaproteobacteria bacterium]